MGAHDANTPTTLQWEPVSFTHKNLCPWRKHTYNITMRTCIIHQEEWVAMTQTHLQHYNGNLYHSPMRMGAHDANTPTTLQWEPVSFTHENGCPWREHTYNITMVTCMTQESRCPWRQHTMGTCITKESGCLWMRTHLQNYNKDLYHPGERVPMTRTHLKHYNENLYNPREGVSMTQTHLQVSMVYTKILWRERENTYITIRTFTPQQESGCLWCEHTHNITIRVCITQESGCPWREHT